MGSSNLPGAPRRFSPGLVFAALALAFLSWSVPATLAQRPSYLAVTAQADAPTQVTLVITSTAGSERRKTLLLAASSEYSRLTMALPATDIASIGIELPSGSAPLSISSILLLDRSRDVLTALPLDRMQAVGSTRLTPGESDLQLSPAAPDSPASAFVDSEVVYAGSSSVASLWIILGATLFGLALNFPRSPLPGLFERPARQRVAVGILALAVLASTGAMARLSRVNAHPDEAAHIIAAKFYTQAWVPAPLGDPALEPAIIPHWGRSYLFELDTVYFFAGKFAHFSGMALEPACRLLQWILLAILLGLTVYLVPSSPSLAVVCALTPQAWYVFSYFNGDAWPLAFALVASMVLASRRLPARLLSDARSERLKWAGLLGLLLGLLLLAKSNYWIFVFWTVIILALKLGLHEGKLTAGRPLKALALVTGLALTIFTIRYGYEQAINDFDRAARLEAFVESHASPGFKPSSVRSDDRRPGMYMRDKGRSFASVLDKGLWFELSGNSALGVYGNPSFNAPRAHYRNAGFAVLAIVVILAFVTWRSNLPRARLVLMTTAVVMVLVVFQSIYHSWTYNFQPQGRYLFPILPMLAVALAPGARLLPGRILAPLALLPFGLSLWSFLAVALERIPR